MSHRSFPKPGKAPLPRAPKAKKGRSIPLAEFDRKVLAREAKKGAKKSVKVKPPGIPAAKKAKAPKASGTKKFKPVNEGLGTMFVKLSPAEIGERGKELAVQLQKREQEVDAQAETRSAMKARLDDFDNVIHRLGIAIREGREERPAPGLFDKLDKHKEKPIAKDTMKKPDAPLAAAAVKKNLDRADAAGIPPVVPGEATLLDKTPEVTA